MSTHPQNDDKNLEEELDSFRNSLGTMDSSGDRKWIYAKKPPKNSKYYNYRTYVGYFLLLFFILTPFIKINGNPLFKFDILNSEFFIFSYPFFTSDFRIFAIGMITTAVFIILFTVVYGRIFCGWICPQTIFLEMVFRKIEFAIDGDRNKQIKLDKQEWDEEKIRKRALKWGIYLVIAFIMSNALFSWIFGVDGIIKMAKEGPFENLTTFFIVLMNTGIIYFVYTWFREQACTLVCPYGRLQGVLIDKKTIVVAYDYKRGEREEGRKRFKRGQDRAAEGVGDCIDCGNCVVVCPTGIDIRNGTQLECVNCTACIDACDDVMEKINLPKGLIRYASEENIAENKPFRFTPRMIAYTALLTILIGVLLSFVFIRTDIDSKFLREPGTDYTEIKDDGLIVNQFQYGLQNKTKETMKVHLKLVSHENGKIILSSGAPEIIIQPGKQIEGNMKIQIPKSDISSYKERIKIQVLNDDKKIIDSYTTSFAAPFQ